MHLKRRRPAYRFGAAPSTLLTGPCRKTLRQPSGSGAEMRRAAVAGRYPLAEPLMYRHAPVGITGDPGGAAAIVPAAYLIHYLTACNFS